MLFDDEVAIAAIPGMCQPNCSKFIRFAGVGFAFPAFPFQIGKSELRLQGQGSFIDFPAGDGGGNGCDITGKMIADKQAISSGVEGHTCHKSKIVS